MALRDAAVAEQRLLRAARRGDRGAEQRLVARHLGLVRAVAARYRGFGLADDDLVQEGALGLLEAIVRYDRSRNVPFEAYARFRVRRAILNALTDRARLIRVPKHAGNVGPRTTPLDPLGPIADETSPDPEREVIAHEEARVVDEAVEHLPPRQRQVVVHRFGIGCPPESVREVAAALRLSPRRTLTIEHEALDALRRSLQGVLER